MKANVKDKIRIIRKMNDWSMEYQEGDVFTVESTWYGGVNVTSKTGVPLSLDEIEYEVIAAEGAEDSAQSPQIHLLFHAIKELYNGKKKNCSWDPISNIADLYGVFDLFHSNRSIRQT